MTKYRTLFAFTIYTLATLLHSISSAKENLDRSEEAVLERVSNEVKYLASDELLSTMASFFSPQGLMAGDDTLYLTTLPSSLWI